MPCMLVAEKPCLAVIEVWWLGSHACLFAMFDGCEAMYRLFDGWEAMLLYFFIWMAVKPLLCTGITCCMLPWPKPAR